MHTLDPDYNPRKRLSMAGKRAFLRWLSGMDIEYLSPLAAEVMASEKPWREIFRQSPEGYGMQLVASPMPRDEWFISFGVLYGGEAGIRGGWLVEISPGGEVLRGEFRDLIII